VVDVIIRDIEASRPDKIKMVAQLFYADDGVVANTNDPENVQRLLVDDYMERFSRVGLKMNDKKTKAMVVEGAKAPTITCRRRRLIGKGE
jgi:hypothetical protein